jgi:hypothetical protein
MSKYGDNKAFHEARQKNLLKNGYKKINTKDELLEEEKGLITFIDKNNNFHKGGFITKISKDNLTWSNLKTQNKIPFEDIKIMYVRSPLRLLNRTKKVTQYHAKIGGVIIYYAQDNFDLLRFKETNRYKKLLEWYNKYVK